MTVKTVAVTKVEKVKAGKTDRVVVHYKGDDGSDWKIGALTVKLGEPTRKFLKTIADGGKEVQADIELTKEGNFWNLIQAAEAGTLKPNNPAPQNSSNSTYKKTSYSAAPAVGRLSDVEKGEGQQRGNVLTNATNLVVAMISNGTSFKNVKETVQYVEDFARELYAVSKRLESNNNNADTTKNEVNKAQQEEAAFIADSVDESNTPDVDW